MDFLRDVRKGWDMVVEHYRPKVADLLIGWGHRIDPQRPAVKVQSGGGWLVHLGGVPLAKIDTGQIIDTRPVASRSRR